MQGFVRLEAAMAAARKIAMSHAYRQCPIARPLLIVCTRRRTSPGGGVWELATTGAELVSALTRRAAGMLCWATKPPRIDWVAARALATADLARTCGLDDETPWQVVHDALLDAGQDTTAGHLATIQAVDWFTK